MRLVVDWDFNNRTESTGIGKGRLYLGWDNAVNCNLVACYIISTLNKVHELFFSIVNLHFFILIRRLSIIFFFHSFEPISRVNKNWSSISSTLKILVDCLHSRMTSTSGELKCCFKLYELFVVILFFLCCS